MSRVSVEDLEALLRFPGTGGPRRHLVQDAVVLSCGCLTSETAFLQYYISRCPNCKSEPVSILSAIQPLRDLYKIVEHINWQLSDTHVKKEPQRSNQVSSLSQSLERQDPTHVQVHSRENPDDESYDHDEILSESLPRSMGTKSMKEGSVPKSVGKEGSLPKSIGQGGLKKEGSLPKSTGSLQRNSQHIEDRRMTDDTMDLISLFYKFAREEEDVPNPIVQKGFEPKRKDKVKGIEGKDKRVEERKDKRIEERKRDRVEERKEKEVKGLFDEEKKDIGLADIPASPIDIQTFAPASHESWLGSSFSQSQYSPELKTLLYENNLLKGLNEEQDYNFSKCFPFYRKLTTYTTQQNKFTLQSAFRSTSMLKKTSRFIGSSLHSQVDIARGGVEVTRFALITDKRWELYEFLNTPDPQKPVMLCCGKSSGEYGANPSSMSQPSEEEINKEIRFTNDFAADNGTEISIKKKLASWDLLQCHLSEQFLVISGTKGLIRVINISDQSPYNMGQVVYTYSTNFPIRCMAVSPNNSLVACGINARERLSGKEQPFVILHHFVTTSSGLVQKVDPITITIPYRDPIKLVNFNALSTHLLCGTVWESRYLIIKLRSNNFSENYRKPRLIWSDVAATKGKPKSRRSTAHDPDKLVDDTGDLMPPSEAVEDDVDSELMMSNEGITDLQFGVSNSVVITSCSLHKRPPLVIRLNGPSLDCIKRISTTDNYSMSNSMNSYEEEEDFNIKSAEVFLRIHEVGSSIHRCALSPRSDGLVFLSKVGTVYLVSIPNFMSSSDSKISYNKVVVQLGEVANAERFTEAASVRFSADGGKVFTVDRKGVFSVFDFTKGVPGDDPEVIKCKIVNL